MGWVPGHTPLEAGTGGEWELVREHVTGAQKNSDDCGVYQCIRCIASTDPFVLGNGDRTVGRAFRFNQSDVSVLRPSVFVVL